MTISGDESPTAPLLAQKPSETTSLRQTYTVRDGHGSDEIKTFQPHDIVAFDMAEIGSFEEVVTRISGGDDPTITFDNGDTLRLCGIHARDLNASNFTFSVGPVSFVAGTPITTQRGDIPIELLRPSDILWTKDHGWQALRMVVRETMKFAVHDDSPKPILIPAGALGVNQPKQDIMVSGQLRVLRSIGQHGDEVLVPAVNLIGRNGIRRMRGKKREEYLNVVMERHSIIQVAGCWVESLLATSRSLPKQTAAARRMLEHAAEMTPTRRIERHGARPRNLRTG
ncbi:Hint domain-containing protein [Gymnodinialimonas sp. 57CJ19]|uniref:Hint domain-containing protein n=1 Tax=Gymnodinialimonas sp. 57CJ19 TaxID=3138498 RepID=UPI00313440E9